MFLFSVPPFFHTIHKLYPRPYLIHVCLYLLQHSPAVEVMDQKMSVKSNAHNVRFCLMACYRLQWTHSTFIMLYHWSFSAQVNKHDLTLCTSNNNMAANKQKLKNTCNPCFVPCCIPEKVSANQIWYFHNK
jgi:hypothetical protein